MENWLDEIIHEQYSIVKVLKDSEKTKIVQLRHKTLKRDLIKHQFSGDSSVYQVLMRISHPNLPKIFEISQSGDSVLVLEEYIDGITIADILENGLYNEKGVKSVISSLCDALQVLHGEHIIHRDIKPENIMVTNAGIVKLIDFDAARVYKLYRSKDTKIIGTTGYAAPEQFGITQSDGRTDIFALGILINVMLTGKHPSKKLYRGRLKKIIEKCVQIDPNKRFQTVIDLKRNL